MAVFVFAEVAEESPVASLRKFDFTASAYNHRQERVIQKQAASIYRFQKDVWNGFVSRLVVHPVFDKLILKGFREFTTHVGFGIDPIASMVSVSTQFCCCWRLATT